MSNENYNVEVQEDKHTCLCHSKMFKKFLITTFGTFFGVLMALCLFTAVHRPPMPMPPMPCPCGCPMMKAMMFHNHHFDQGMRGDFQKKIIKEKPVKIEIED